MQLIAYDSFYRDNVGFANVRINVIRNPSPPVFSLPGYTVTINENYPLGDVVVDVQASDNDGVSDRFVRATITSAIDDIFLEF